MTRKNKILSFISQEEYRPMNIREIMCILSVPKGERKQLEDILTELEAEGKILKNKQNRYISVSDTNYIKGIFYAKPQGYGFVISDDDEKYFVNPDSVHGAYNKDSVLIKVTRNFDDKSGKCSEAVIIKILAHSNDNIVGTFHNERNFGFVIPNNKSFGSDIYISKKQCAGIKSGVKVSVKVIKWPDGDRNPEGEITEVLGFAEDAGVDLKSVLTEHGIEDKFSPKAELSALSFGNKVYAEETDGREDFRDRLIFTIDGADSKDFDDAVEIEKTENGYKLGVHIADVSYYVAENSVLDNEARKRGTSIYFPGKVIPMLPEKLSNGICSLNPDEDRLTLSVIMDFDESGNMVSHRICESVICSKYRMTYDDVSEMLVGNEKQISKYNEIYPSVKLMHKLSNILKKKRNDKGSIDFSFPEIKIETDENGKATNIYKYYSTKAHSIIEEFMLSANVCVAEEMFWSEIPFIFRIHEKPSYEKFKEFSEFISRFGYHIKGNKDNLHSKSFADILTQIKGTDKELIISKVLLRSLMKAKYSSENVGHFGLAFQHYCHFTSPIRRYPDLVIHRIIKEHIRFGISENRERFLKSFVSKAAKLSSEAEIRAMEAEREYEDIKKAEFMSKYIGDEFHTTITSVTSFGIFCQTDFGIEGLITMSELDDDYYIFDEKNLSLTGKNTGKTYTIGMELDIIVKRADADLREIDFSIKGDDTIE